MVLQFPVSKITHTALLWNNRRDTLALTASNKSYLRSFFQKADVAIYKELLDLSSRRPHKLEGSKTLSAINLSLTSMQNSLLWSTAFQRRFKRFRSKTLPGSSIKCGCSVKSALLKCSIWENSKQLWSIRFFWAIQPDSDSAAAAASGSPFQVESPAPSLSPPAEHETPGESQCKHTLPTPSLCYNFELLQPYS